MKDGVVTWAAPAGEPCSPDYELEVGGVPVFVYAARVRSEILQHPGLWSHPPGGGRGETASFAIFDLRGPATVTVRPRRPCREAVVLPSRHGIAATVADGAVTFVLEQPRHVTVLADGRNSAPLHLFAGAPETDVPGPGDANVIRFGPGLHEIDPLRIGAGQAVYLAGGAVVRARRPPDTQGTYSEKWKVTFFNGAIFGAEGADDVRISGRGILDGSLVPHPGYNMIRASGCRRVRLSGITLRDAPNWNVLLSDCEGVDVEDLRILSGRLNSDGINSVNSRQVRVRRCFVRNHDDSIVAKTMSPGKPCEDLAAEDCVVWSDWGYALGATYETRAPVRNLRFRRCDILAARHWCLGVHVSDSATVSGVSFEDIGVADLAATRQDGLPGSAKLARLVIQADCWGHDAQRGRIRDIAIDGVTVDGTTLPPSELLGADAEHAVERVTMRGIRLRGGPEARAAELNIHANAFVRDVTAGAPAETPPAARGA